jgi:ATP adenylyltransferase
MGAVGGSASGSSMDRMWAGWRSAYVAAAGNGALAGEGSVFRRILESGLPDDETHVVWRGSTVFAILNAYPYTPGHLLVMPYREVGELEGLTGAESAELWSAVRAAVVAVKRAYSPQGVNVGANLGEAAGAGVPSHLHLHVLPRWNADSNFMTAVAEVRVLPETLGDSWRKLRDAWPSGPSSGPGAGAGSSSD